MKKYIVITQDSEGNDLVSEIQTTSKEELEEYLINETNGFIIISANKFKNIEKLKFIDGTMYCDEAERAEDKSIDGIYKLKQISYCIHKKNSEEILKASYNFKSEHGWVWTSLYLMFDREGYPNKKAIEWLSLRVNKSIEELTKMNLSTKDVYEYIEIFQKPDSVKIEMNDSGYPIIAEEIWYK